MAAPWIMDDGLGQLIQPLLPPGPRPIDDRRCRQGVLLMLHTGIGGEDLRGGSGMTCGRRWRRWTGAGIFDQLPRILLAALPAAGAIDWSQAVADTARLRAKKGGAGVSGPGRSTAPAQAPSIS